MKNSTITVFEVSPRDGLQNEKRIVPLRYKVDLIRGLIRAGLHQIEAGAFVRPDLVPRMADTDQLFLKIQPLEKGKISFWSLVPNRKGLERALKAGARNIALFTAATDEFARRNIGMTVKESLSEFKKVIEAAREVSGNKISFRGYVSTAFGCPYEGKVAPGKALKVIERLADLGVDQISVGDTIGVAVPSQVNEVLGRALKLVGPKQGREKIAAHFHDTRGTALANALRAYDLGIRIFDSSAGGLGGCPFAPGASGNLATEDLVYMFEKMGVNTSVDLKKLCETSLDFSRKMHRPLSSKYLQAYAPHH